MSIDTKQFNVTLSADLINEFKKHCHIKGITFAGLLRDVIPRIMFEDITLDFEQIRRKDFEYRNAGTVAKGSRF